MTKDVISNLSSLDVEVLNEVIREGEIQLRAQFEAANNFDVRAMAWVRMLVSTAVATTAASLALHFSGGEKLIVVVGILFAIFLTSCAIAGVQCVSPSKFSFPGNSPANWFPSEWITEGDFSLKQAKLEQAHCLDSAIEKNTAWASKRARMLKSSMEITIGGVLLAFAVIFIAVLS